MRLFAMSPRAVSSHVGAHFERAMDAMLSIYHASDHDGTVERGHVCPIATTGFVRHIVAVIQ